MGQYSSYYLYQKYEKRGDQPFVPVYPAVYSVDGDGTREPVVKNENDYECGWTGETGTLYRWVDVPIDTDYICDECPEVQYRWVETGEYRCEYSADTPDAQYRWVDIPINEDYMCSGTSKYYKQKYQVSYDSGATWSDVLPAQYRMGDLYEVNSIDCGAEVMYRWMQLPIDTDYMCSGTSKYYKEVYQVSTDGGSTWNDVVPAQYREGNLYEVNSIDCGAVATYRWYQLPISEGYFCSGTSKYYRQKHQVSYDDGETWSDVEPAEYKLGDFYEDDSYDCRYENQYFTIESLDDNNEVKFPVDSRTELWYITISASTDYGATWTEYTTLPNHMLSIATLDAGQKVLIKGLNRAYYETNGLTYHFNRFYPTGRYIVYGNIMSLCNGDEFATANTLLGSGSNFYWFFGSSTKLISAENLVLPATTLTEACYRRMFQNCINLTKAPSILPAMTLTDNCYDGMFRGCTSLTTAPELPATRLTYQCYGSMFSGCTSLERAPELPCTYPAATSYHHMFDGCSSLNYIKCLVSQYCYLHPEGWVTGVAPTGTFVKNQNKTNWEIGENGIPEGWTVQDA